MRPQAPTLKFDRSPQAAETGPPQSRSTSGQRAPFVRRVAATAVDGLLLLLVDAAVMYLTLRVAGLPLHAAAALPSFPLVTFLLVLNGGYLVALTALGGQTIGKMATGLRVLDSNGTRVTGTKALVRTLAWPLAALPAGLGYLGLVLPTGRALHDSIAGTRVVRV